MLYLFWWYKYVTLFLTNYKLAWAIVVYLFDAFNEFILLI